MEPAGIEPVTSCLQAAKRLGAKSQRYPAMRAILLIRRSRDLRAIEGGLGTGPQTPRMHNPTQQLERKFPQHPHVSPQEKEESRPSAGVSATARGASRQDMPQDAVSKIVTLATVTGFGAAITSCGPSGLLTPTTRDACETAVDKTPHVTGLTA
jgi:hypothetical protein